MLNPPPALSVIIPASNEAAWIGPCLAAVFASDPVPGGAEVIVVANGCRDRTAEIARAVPVPAGWEMTVLDLAEGSKPGALNAGGAVARGRVLAWLDADCLVSPGVMAGLVAALAGPRALYAGATPQIPRAKSWFTRAYARFWQQLPFAQSTAPGYGLYATNPEGRARWGEFPRLISDDTFVRLRFEPEERVQIAAPYAWPMVEGFAALVRVRRRQDLGVRELAATFPGILEREGKASLGAGGLIRLAARDPLGFAAYAAVALAVRRRQGGAEFTRGR
ncbi:glycosyltransferase family 2 protein [Paracoccus sp. IB05]|uniref:glycosyltransferase n=1 Tax=Paracoccus sp. IB05 TaxID=2779367 RepID=UPI0018E77366|nr:glycosyltransferase [Paracoccus sp. IB05]MBJ2152336.1 glycosyltransferase [Paracoccus sp. IB05]